MSYRDPRKQPRLKAGSRVHHPEHGKGYVLGFGRLDSNTAQVEFDETESLSPCSYRAVPREELRVLGD